MADLNLGYGYVIYTPNIPQKYHDQEVTLEFEGGIIPDQIIIIIDGVLRSIIEPSENIKHLDLFLGKTLDFLVVNEGRAAYAPRGVHYLPEMKGMFGKVRIKGTNDYLNDWSMYNVNDTTMIQTIEHFTRIQHQESYPRTSNFKPYCLAYYGTFWINIDVTDTFLHIRGFHRGQLYVNQFNVGRFRQDIPPQQTLYIPKQFLRFGINSISVVTLDPWPQDSSELYGEFFIHPVLN